MAKSKTQQVTQTAPEQAPALNFAERIIAYMKAKGYQIDRNPGEVNIVYLEGSNEDGTPNRDRMDEWNDRRIVIQFVEGQPVIVHNAVATSEPGWKGTTSQAAKKRGGVARIQFGQFDVWQMGYHKYAQIGPRHPALVQRRPLKVHRDANQDGKRTGDVLDLVTGLNQHGVNSVKEPGNVGSHSEGCLVGLSWPTHLQFIQLCRADPRYQADNQYYFRTTIIAGDDFAKTAPK